MLFDGSWHGDASDKPVTMDRQYCHVPASGLEKLWPQARRRGKTVR